MRTLLQVSEFMSCSPKRFVFISMSSIDRLNEDDDISREDSTEAEHEAAGAVEARARRHPHRVEGTKESIHQAAELKL